MPRRKTRRPPRLVLSRSSLHPKAFVWPGLIWTPLQVSWTPAWKNRRYFETVESRLAIYLVPEGRSKYQRLETLRELRGLRASLSSPWRGRAKLRLRFDFVPEGGSKYQRLKTLRELRGLRARPFFSGALARPISRRFPFFPERRKTRTEVTEFTEGLTPLELAGRLPSQFRSGTV
jgi:hypothetical protein